MSSAPQQFIYNEELYKLPQKTIVLIPVSWETVPEDQVILLGKILGSVKLSLAGVQILCHEKVDLQKLQVFNPSLIISFGTTLHPKSEFYTATEVNGIRVIQSDALGSLDDAKKKSLWNALKLAFA